MVSPRIGGGLLLLTRIFTPPSIMVSPRIGGGLLLLTRIFTPPSIMVSPRICGGLLLLMRIFTPHLPGLRCFASTLLVALLVDSPCLGCSLWTIVHAPRLPSLRLWLAPALLVTLLIVIALLPPAASASASLVSICGGGVLSGMLSS
ncbi:hypothetical protein B0H19DRAFT_1177079 [Mycena capillaripes]|nr:hypothetical protein B0H19DRAFT_1177079 [Mycena capillaripes]